MHNPGPSAAQIELQNLTIDGLWFTSSSLCHSERLSVKEHEGRRIYTNPEVALRTGQSHTPLKPLVLMRFEPSCETRGEQIPDNVTHVFSGQNFCSVLAPHQNGIFQSLLGKAKDLLRHTDSGHTDSKLRLNADFDRSRFRCFSNSSFQIFLPSQPDR